MPSLVGSEMCIRDRDITGPLRKLSRPWHGPYRITSNERPDVCVTKVYFSQDKEIRVHLSRVKLCPPNFPAGFYWYGGKKRGPGCPPKWVEQIMSSGDQMETQTRDDSPTRERPHTTKQQGRSKATSRKSTEQSKKSVAQNKDCLLYTSPSPRD